MQCEKSVLGPVKTILKIMKMELVFEFEIKLKFFKSNLYIF